VTAAGRRWLALFIALLAVGLGGAAAVAAATAAAPPAAAATRAATAIPFPPIPTVAPRPTSAPTAPSPAATPTVAPDPTGTATTDPAPTDVSGSATQAGLFDPLNGTIHGATIFSYDFMGDDGSAWNVGAKASYAVGNWAWQANTLVVGFSEWLMDWTLQFKLADAVVAPVNRIAASYKAQVVDPLGAKTLFLTVAVVICGLRLWRGRHSNAAAEYLITMLISVLGATALAAPGTALLGAHGPFTLSKEVGSTAAAIALTDNDSTIDLSSPVVSVIGETFVRRPHQLVNFGREFPDGSHCADVYQKIVEKGPWGTQDDPRDRMRACDKKAADFNGSETGLAQRATAALLTAVASALISLFIIVVSMGLLLAQLSMAIAAVLGVFVLPLAVIPGFGRALLARWAGTVLAAAAAVVGAMAFFGLLMRVIQVVLAGDGGLAVPLVGRFAVIDLIVIGGFIGRHKLLTAIRRAAHRFAEQAHEMSAGIGGGAAKAVPVKQLAGTANPRAIAARIQQSGASTVRAGAAVGQRAVQAGRAGFAAGAAVGRIAAPRNTPATSPAGTGAAAGGWSKPRPASQLGTSVAAQRDDAQTQKRKAAATQLASIAVNVGALAATGGASAAVTAGTAARTAGATAQSANAAARARRIQMLVRQTRLAEAARTHAQAPTPPTPPTPQTRQIPAPTTPGRATPVTPALPARPVSSSATPASANPSVTRSTAGLDDPAAGPVRPGRDSPRPAPPSTRAADRPGRGPAPSGTPLAGAQPETPPATAGSRIRTEQFPGTGTTPPDQPATADPDTQPTPPVQLVRPAPRHRRDRCPGPPG